MNVKRRSHSVVLCVACVVLALALAAVGALGAVKIGGLNDDIGNLKKAASDASERYSRLESDYKALDSNYKAADEQRRSEKERYESLLASERAAVSDLKEKVSSLTASKAAMSGASGPGAASSLAPKEYPAGTKVAYLTFDDGPSGHTEQILKVLEEKGAKATFFVCGTRHPEKIATIHNSGNLVAIHSKTHNYKTIYSSTDAYFKDLYELRDLIKSETGVAPTVVRLPGGSSNTVSKKYCKGVVSSVTKRLTDEGYTYFDWNVDSGDANGNNISADKLYNNIVKNVGEKQYINVLMHDTDAKKTTLEALPRIIDFLKSKGYVFDVCTPDAHIVHHKVAN